MMLKTSEVLELVKKLLKTLLRQVLRPYVSLVVLGGDVVNRYLSLANEVTDVEKTQRDVLRARAVRAVPDHV